jgi:hypothetical protein
MSEQEFQWTVNALISECGFTQQGAEEEAENEYDIFIGQSSEEIITEELILDYFKKNGSHAQAK